KSGSASARRQLDDASSAAGLVSADRNVNFFQDLPRLGEAISRPRHQYGIQALVHGELHGALIESRCCWRRRLLSLRLLKGLEERVAALLLVLPLLLLLSVGWIGHQVLQDGFCILGVDVIADVFEAVGALLVVLHVLNVRLDALDVA